MPLSLDELLTKIKSTDKVVVEIGCGPNKMAGATIGIDHLPLPGVDYVADLEKGLPFLPDNSVDEIHSTHVLEHVTNFEGVMKDIHRVLKKGGKNFVTVPHFSNPYYYSDYTHKRFFGLYTFDYFDKGQHKLKRKVPSFYNNFHFNITKRKLVFKSSFFLPRQWKKHIVQPIVNSSLWMQEFYEGSFCYRVSCFELRFEMTPEK